MTAAQDAIAVADLNVGVAVVNNRGDERYGDLNVGVTQPTTQTILTQAVGWGVTPVVTRSVTRSIVPDDIRYADLNVT